MLPVSFPVAEITPLVEINTDRNQSTRTINLPFGSRRDWSAIKRNAFLCPPPPVPSPAPIRPASSYSSLESGNVEESLTGTMNNETRVEMGNGREMTWRKRVSMEKKQHSHGESRLIHHDKALSSPTKSAIYCRPFLTF